MPSWEKIALIEKIYDRYIYKERQESSEASVSCTPDEKASQKN